MNAAALADGYTDGGANGARKALESVWASVSRSARFSPFQRGPLDVLLGLVGRSITPHVRRHGHDVETILPL
jgi:hypothetical protein